MQYSTAIRDAQINAVATTVGNSPVLEIWDGEKPDRCDSQDSGVLIAVGTLPAEWISQSQGGAASMASEWRLLGQIGAGMGKHGSYFRIKQAGICHMQGTFGQAKEMIPDAAQIAHGQSIVVKLFSLKRGNE